MGRRGHARSGRGSSPSRDHARASEETGEGRAVQGLTGGGRGRGLGDGGAQESGGASGSVQARVQGRLVGVLRVHSSFARRQLLRYSRRFQLAGGVPAVLDKEEGQVRMSRRRGT
jgi:hypothetical protein